MSVKDVFKKTAFCCIFAVHAVNTRVLSEAQRNTWGSEFPYSVCFCLSQFKICVGFVIHVGWYQVMKEDGYFFSKTIYVYLKYNPQQPCKHSNTSYCK